MGNIGSAVDADINLRYHQWLRYQTISCYKHW